MLEDQRRILEQQLWNITNTLRGKMNADEFRDYILGFIFYKCLSEKITSYVDDELLKSDGLKFAGLDENTPQGQEYIEAIREATIEGLGYFLKPSELFCNIARKGSNLLGNDESDGNFILEDLGRILRNIENSTLGNASEDDFINLFEELDLASTKLGNTVQARNKLVAKILFHLDQISFYMVHAQSDVLGDAYEYLIAEFASGAGKKAGEFYTPQTVSTLLARLVTAGRQNLKNIYDPTCGSGSLLLRVKREAVAKGGSVGRIYGQELNRTTYNLARMNMILHDVHYADFDIRQEDTLEHPQHLGLHFDAIVANPPFSANWSANPLFLNDERFSRYGKLAPASKADMAFVQHMIYHLTQDGSMACVLPHGVLFRGAAEGVIREHIIRELNCLDAVVGLPSNIFYGTSIPTCVLMFRKCRKDPDNILFIDASQGFEKNKTKNLLRPEDIDRIVTTYENWQSIEKYSAVAPVSEIANNGYNLNISRYIDTVEAKEEIDLDAVTARIQEIDQDMVAVDRKLAEFCQELGLRMPF